VLGKFPFGILLCVDFFFTENGRKRAVEGRCVITDQAIDSNGRIMYARGARKGKTCLRVWVLGELVHQGLNTGLGSVDSLVARYGEPNWRPVFLSGFGRAIVSKLVKLTSRTFGVKQFLRRRNQL
jgi:hypothetical protein